MAGRQTRDVGRIVQNQGVLPPGDRGGQGPQGVLGEGISASPTTGEEAEEKGEEGGGEAMADGGVGQG